MVGTQRLTVPMINFLDGVGAVLLGEGLAK